MSTESSAPGEMTGVPPLPPQIASKIALGGAMATGIAAVIGLVVDGSSSAPADSDGPGAVAFLRLALTVVGMFGAGIAVWLQPRRVAILALACLTGVLARAGFPATWDSGRMVAGFGAIIVGIAAVLMAMPVPYRRAGVSLIILFHFGGVVTAVTGPPTYNSPPPWLTTMSHTYIYRTYSRFIHMTNAYHFYSPEPGPASQVWFCIHYKNPNAKPGEDPRRDSRWYKLPRRPEDIRDPLALAYYRRLSLTMQLETYAPVPFIPPDVLRRREVKSHGEYGIRWHNNIAQQAQYRPPADSVRYFLLPSYVRHVASLKECQHPDPNVEIYSIKVYRVEHHILTAPEWKQSRPYDPDTYLPYFQGEYDKEGNAINTDDPMLFWLVPIIYEPKKDRVVPAWHTPKDNPDDFILRDGVKLHSGSDYESR